MFLATPLAIFVLGEKLGTTLKDGDTERFISAWDRPPRSSVPARPRIHQA
jgi:hypothetical protein